MSELPIRQPEPSYPLLASPSLSSDPLEAEDPSRFKATILIFIFIALSTDDIGSLSFSEFESFLNWTISETILWFSFLMVL